MATTEARPIAHLYHARLRLRKPGIRIVQVILGLMWILAGALQCQPFMFSKGFVSQIIAPVAQGQPGWIGGSITWSVHVMSHHLVFSNAVFATTQVLIGVGLLFRRSVKVALIVSFAWVLGVWWFGEGLGMIPMGMASPLTGAPGAVLLYGLVGALVWPAGPKATRAETCADEDKGILAAGWTVPGGRIAWAALWFLAAALWLQCSNRDASSFHDTVQNASYGWLGGAQHSNCRCLERARSGHRHRTGHGIGRHRSGSVHPGHGSGCPCRRRRSFVGLLGIRPELRSDHHREGNRHQCRATVRAARPSPLG